MVDKLAPLGHGEINALHAFAAAILSGAAISL